MIKYWCGFGEKCLAYWVYTTIWCIFYTSYKHVSRVHNFRRVLRLVAALKRSIQFCRELNEEYFNKKIKSEQRKMAEILIKYWETRFSWDTRYINYTNNNKIRESNIINLSTIKDSVPVIQLYIIKVEWGDDNRSFKWIGTSIDFYYLTVYIVFFSLKTLREIPRDGCSHHVFFIDSSINFIIESV